METLLKVSDADWALAKPRERVLSTLGLMMLDSDLNRRHLHHPGRMFLPGMGILHRLLTHEDQQELREKIGFGTLHSSLLASTSWLACSLLITGKSGLHINGKCGMKMPKSTY